MRPEDRDLVDDLEFGEVPAVSKPDLRIEDGPVDEMAMLAHWERLRVVYNAILAVEVVVISLPIFRLTWAQDGFLWELLVGAIGANLCFCAGPVLNYYLHWANVRGRSVTTVLFVIGTIVMIFLTLVYVVIFL